ncbi:MAG: hypothetical protein HOK30_11200 [Rhodospirillaceae bacterium]|jgi:hypothetical protein|nr:hypothetical protein [Rhodospirillaceae bacterium]MBT6428220.1 hypothetical protein [Rhodospirillaceae bacterium]
MNDSPANNDTLFEGLVAASRVPLSAEEKKNLRAAFSSLMDLAAQTRKPGRPWETRPLPYYTPAPPKGDDT